VKEFRTNVELKGKNCPNLYAAPLLFRTFHFFFTSYYTQSASPKLKHTETGLLQKDSFAGKAEIKENVLLCTVLLFPLWRIHKKGTCDVPKPIYGRAPVWNYPTVLGAGTVP
jgi:hypothetical protein